MKGKIIVHFTLTGRFDPDNITLITGLRPDKTWRYGESIQSTLLKYKHDGWRISTEEHEGTELHEEFKILLNRIFPYFKKLREVMLRSNLDAEFACVISADDDQLPPIYFPPDIIKHIARLNASIDIDIYGCKPL